MFDSLRQQGYEIRFLSHAEAILKQDFPEASEEIEKSLVNFSIPITEIIGSGGGEALGTQRLRRSLAAQKWVKTKFELVKSINGVPRESISHEVDHVREFDYEGGKAIIAMEIEWNNKDPFFDRDLENFKRLHAEGGISMGIIITRGTELQNGLRGLVRRFTIERDVQSFTDLKSLGLRPTSRQVKTVNGRVNRKKNPLDFGDAWATHFVSDKYGQATTHWRKLMDRVDRGVGHPCPLLLIGLPASIVSFDPTDRIQMVEANEAEDE
ncbi:BglII/BstYI family type II restriction endonuclease [Pseudoduganella sp. SL102]|uniref:BglII/BstYI family type II restriction endonuclease n=1 Tax=Pseudoduganella sp. SL102 TaxID=2995154 RepID=UPI00248AB873|nr:BglII/BstYI family type II restriction endonuclease [Pseudoduganella sp. SL102]WBS04214.1 BglII/BstYI family type II restriction endonuclease [Pseudoduganella sp. SL102]